ncbi:pentatricopeptide repeat-containing protein At4g39530-like [Macadamia integrifolia]|uniref:pentatricopeptide repeat-containing protein At4g39530-like n=1 Tax=Macadamia integrifolia TaxID=60698 RepID=UPI001C4FEB0D|nr:pentatricopeptide repeat-containing protein At4g39530-like [Macadamia integrifolia]
MGILPCCSSLPYAKPILLSKHPAPKLPKPLDQHSQSLKSVTTQNNILLSSYSKSRSLDQTIQLFGLLSLRNTVTWNIVISACSRKGCYAAALNLFFDMVSSSSYQPDTLTFRTVLRVCDETDNYPLALQIHAFMVKLPFLWSSDLITGTCLIKLYCKFGEMKVAQDIFDIIPQRDIVAFTTVMVGYTEVGNYEETIRLYRIMVERENLVPNDFALTGCLKACARGSFLFEGKQIHAYIVKESLQSDVFVGTALIDMYAKCDRMEFAEKLFFETPAPSVISWNALMAGNLGDEKVLLFFSRMWESGASPDHVTFATVLRACKNVNPTLVQQIHGLLTKVMGTEVDVFVGDALFELYMNHGCASDAREVFERIHHKDVRAFNMAIKGCIINGFINEGIDLFHEGLQMEMVPNEATLLSLVRRVQDLNQGKQLHALVIKFGFSAATGDGHGALVASSLIVMYTDHRCLDDAVQLFNIIHAPDLVLWTSIISGFSRSGEFEKALELYVLMLLDGPVEPPNHFTFSSVLQSCANLAAVEEGMQVHAQIIKSQCQIESDLFIANGLVDMYAKCGYITEARKLFDNMTVKDLASWNSMITGLARNGNGDTAIEIFEELLRTPNLQPNHVTYVGVLSACSHTGLLKTGYRYFHMIVEPTIDHYACLVDLLARAGHLEEATNLIKEMPFEPNEVIWSSLLAASCSYGNIELSEYSAEHLLSMNPEDPGTYVALSNMYAAAGRWEDANKVRNLMKDRGVKKLPGRSWLLINGKTHVFFASEK